MKKNNSKRYRSYREKKSQTKKYRIYFARIFILIVFYSLFTTFFAISFGVNSSSMEPTINVGDNLIINTTKNFKSIINSNIGQQLKRGDVVLTNTNFVNKITFIEKLIDPIIRIFTLQKKSLVYDNSSYKGRAELLRVVGLPGDTIKIKDNTVYIKPSGNSFFLSEFELTEKEYDITKKIYPASWKKEFPFSSELEELIISENNYFLISDNRGIFNDSRVFGLINKNEIKGKVLLKYWPLNEFKLY